VEAWARALRGCDRPIQPFSSLDDLVNELSSPDISAVCIASAQRDLVGLIRRAIIARKHVLSAVPVADSRQLILLDELARNRERILLFDACGLGSEALDAVRAIVRDEHPVRRARYIRAHRSEPGAASLESLSIESVSRVLTLAAGLPAQVGAIAPRFSEDEVEPSLISLTMRFESGLVARVDTTSLEPEPADTLTIMCDGRTSVVDERNFIAPVHVVSALRRHDADRDGATGAVRIEQPLVAALAREERMAIAFTDALRNNEPLSNARELAAAAVTWETGRASLVRGGEMVSLPSGHPLIGTARPQLHVIHGGGNTVDTSSVPRLRVVHGGRSAEETVPPPRSA
jgi:predicted dehydrogenase